MTKYYGSLKLSALALSALLVAIFLPEAAFLSLIAFLILINMAVFKALNATSGIRSKLLLLLIFSAVLGLSLYYVGSTTMNPPQCPDNYSQQQIDLADGDCIVGANIGLGLYVLFIVLPAATLLLGLWLKFSYGLYKRQTAPKINQ